MVRLLFLFLFVAVSVVKPKFCYGQLNSKINIFNTSFITKDTLSISIKLKTIDTIYFPNNCTIFDNKVDVYPMFLCYELEEYKNGKYFKFLNSSYNVNSPLLLTDTIKSNIFECGNLIFSYKFEERRKYRIRYYVHFDRFNPGLSMIVTEWYDLKFKKP